MFLRLCMTIYASASALSHNQDDCLSKKAKQVVKLTKATKLLAGVSVGQRMCLICDNLKPTHSFLMQTQHAIPQCNNEKFKPNHKMFILCVCLMILTMVEFQFLNSNNKNLSYFLLSKCPLKVGINLGSSDCPAKLIGTKPS